LTRRTLTTVAMGTAGIMLAHQVASKAFRDATFLSAWPATALPGMTLVTAALVLALVPVFSRLLARYSPLIVVTLGFAASAAAHLLEWNSYGQGRAIAVVVYLHLAGVSALLLSGFWSLIAERFDPAAARAAYGRIAASGTLGGVVGSIAADRVPPSGASMPSCRCWRRYTSDARSASWRSGARLPSCRARPNATRGARRRES
jgi:hypothetical protein